MLLVGTFLALAGFVIVLLARHGFMVGTHPFCASCQFNLTGLPEKHPRCPECGSDILREGSVRIGYRRPIFAGMAVGACIGVAGAICLGAGGVAWWETFDASSLKPIAMLETELAASREPTRAAAYRELLRRIRAGHLSAKQVQHLADLVIKRQADAALPWDPRFGDLIQAARQQRQLPAATWEQYLRQALQLKVTVRPRIEANARRAFRIELNLHGGSNNQSIAPGNVSAEMEVTSQEGATMRFALEPMQRLDLFSQQIEWIDLGMPDPKLGTRKVNVRVRVTLTDVAGAQISKETAAELSYDMLPPGVPAVTKHVATTDEIAEMQTAVRLQLPPGPLTPLPDQPLALGSLLLSGPPVAAGFRIVLRQQDREWTLARILVRANDGLRVPLSLPAQRAGNGPQHGPAEVVCVPEIGLASTTVDIMEVWGDEVRRPIILEAP